ncbi:hypothetical protein Raf01_02460 [Rugosimonospora africana]|uniref:Uncharacterized protein n=1 Tax=Rugosimonospora africana TaxID=556532 RepID=A0A8J3QJC5_9ACTN|nr:hypothetical protein Raf01_02460 [Rugosimonospora africana]
MTRPASDRGLLRTPGCFGPGPPTDRKESALKVIGAGDVGDSAGTGRNLANTIVETSTYLTLFGGGRRTTGTNRERSPIIDRQDKP